MTEDVPGALQRRFEQEAGGPVQDRWLQIEERLALTKADAPPPTTRWAPLAAAAAVGLTVAGVIVIRSGAGPSPADPAPIAIGSAAAATTEAPAAPVSTVTPGPTAAAAGSDPAGTVSGTTATPRPSQEALIEVFFQLDQALSELPGWYDGGLDSPNGTVEIQWKGEVPATGTEIAARAAQQGIAVRFIAVRYSGAELAKILDEVSRALDAGPYLTKVNLMSARQDGFVVGGPGLPENAEAVAGLQKDLDPVLGGLPLVIVDNKVNGGLDGAEDPPAIDVQPPPTTR